MVNALRCMGDQTHRHGDAERRAAVEKEQLVVVDIAVIPRGALGARNPLDRSGEEVHHVYPGRLHEQVHRGRQIFTLSEVTTL